MIIAQKYYDFNATTAKTAHNVASTIGVIEGRSLGGRSALLLHQNRKEGIM